MRINVVKVFIPYKYDRFWVLPSRHLIPKPWCTPVVFKYSKCRLHMAIMLLNILFAPIFSPAPVPWFYQILPLQSGFNIGSIQIFWIGWLHTWFGCFLNVTCGFCWQTEIGKSWHACMHHSICNVDTGAFSCETRQPCVRDLTAVCEVQSVDSSASSSQTRQPCVRDLTAVYEVQTSDSSSSSS